MGSLWQRPPFTEIPLWTETLLTETPDRDPLHRDPCPLDRDPLRQRPPGQRPPWQRPPLWTEWHTGVNALPSRNFVAGGKNTQEKLTIKQPKLFSGVAQYQRFKCYGLPIGKSLNKWTEHGEVRLFHVGFLEWKFLVSREYKLDSFWTRWKHIYSSSRRLVDSVSNCNWAVYCEAVLGKVSWPTH